MEIIIRLLNALIIILNTMHKPNKRFGQNFLQNSVIINNIVESAHLNENNNVIEIGPGLGALTKVLLKNLNFLTAIEIDKNLINELLQLKGAENKLKIINADVLTIDFSQFGENLRVIGNLPYNISTPLIFHLLNFQNIIEDMHFMLQKEVVERLAAKPNNKQYGRLSIMLQYCCEVEHVFNIAPENFFPQPKVDSAFVRITPYKTSPYEQINYKNLESLLAKAFTMRRKTLANNLKSLISANELELLEINPKSRPEEVSIKDYVKIVKSLYK